MIRHFGHFFLFWKKFIEEKSHKPQNQVRNFFKSYLKESCVETNFERNSYKNGLPEMTQCVVGPFNR